MAKGARGGKRGAQPNGRTEIETKAAKHVGKQEVSDFIKSRNPGDFLENPPDSVTLGGVKFEFLGMTKGVVRGKTVYTTSYQSTKQAANGEWPVFETHVSLKKRKGGQTPEFVTGSVGTGLK